MWELQTKEIPFSDSKLFPSELEKEIVYNNLRPSIDSKKWDSNYQSLTLSLWQPIPKQRPYAKKVIQAISNLKENKSFNLSTILHLPSFTNKGDGLNFSFLEMTNMNALLTERKKEKFQPIKLTFDFLFENRRFSSPSAMDDNSEGFHHPFKSTVPIISMVFSENEIEEIQTFSESSKEKSLDTPKNNSEN